MASFALHFVISPLTRAISFDMRTRSAAHGLRRWERALDPSALVIKALERPGLARNVVEIAPERQRQRETGPGPLRAAPRV